MARALSEIEAEIRGLERSDQERLLHVLLEELDGIVDSDKDQLWLDEAQRRSEGFEDSLLKFFPSQEVLDRARARLKDRR